MAEKHKRILTLSLYSKALDIKEADNLNFTINAATWEKKKGRIILNTAGNMFYGSANIVDTKTGSKMIALRLAGDDAPFTSAVLSKFSNDNGETYLGGRSYDASETEAITAAGIAGDRKMQNELRNTTGTRLSANVGKFDKAIAPLGDIVRKPKRRNVEEVAPAAPATRALSLR